MASIGIGYKLTRRILPSLGFRFRRIAEQYTGKLYYINEKGNQVRVDTVRREVALLDKGGFLLEKFKNAITMERLKEHLNHEYNRGSSNI